MKIPLGCYNFMACLHLKNSSVKLNTVNCLFITRLAIYSFLWLLHAFYALCCSYITVQCPCQEWLNGKPRCSHTSTLFKPCWEFPVSSSLDSDWKSSILLRINFSKILEVQEKFWITTQILIIVKARTWLVSSLVLSPFFLCNCKPHWFFLFTEVLKKKSLPHKISTPSLVIKTQGLWL